MALTLCEPWATLVALGYKRWETRPGGISWSGHRGPLAIHAAKATGDIGRAHELWALAGLPGEFPGELEPRALAKTLGCLLAAVDVVRSVKIASTFPPSPGWQFGFAGAGDEQVSISRAQEALGNFAAGRWAIELSNVRRLQEPVPARGYQGLWTLPPDAERRVLEQVGRRELRAGA